jgi:hypothetical protein
MVEKDLWICGQADPAYTQHSARLITLLPSNDVKNVPSLKKLTLLATLV